jgi:hypothetical protein
MRLQDTYFIDTIDTVVVYLATRRHVSLVCVGMDLKS